MPASLSAARPSTTSSPAMSDFNIGMIGQGTVGAAFAELLGQRAEHVRAITGMRPVITAIHTRSNGAKFEDVLDGTDLVVELIGGLEPAREYVLTAMKRGKHVVTANKQLLAHHGEELWAA